MLEYDGDSDFERYGWSFYQGYGEGMMSASLRTVVFILKDAHTNEHGGAAQINEIFPADFREEMKSLLRRFEGLPQKRQFAGIFRETEYLPSLTAYMDADRIRNELTEQNGNHNE